MVRVALDSLHTVAAIVAGIPIDGQHNAGLAMPDLIRLAQSHGLGPLLLRRLQQDSAGPRDSNALAPLIAERNEVAIRQLIAAQTQDEVGHALAQANIPVVWLKGVVLARTAYPSPELRPMDDVDILVPYPLRNSALEVVLASGFCLGRTLLFDGREGLKHHYCLDSSRRPISLELHFRLLGPLDRLLTIEDQEWFWDHTQNVELPGGSSMRALQPEAHLLYLCAHAVLQHGEAGLRLVWLYDLDRILASSPGLDWDLLISAAVRMRWTYAVERALALARDYFSTPLPDRFLQELAARRPDDERVALAQRKQNTRTVTETVADDLSAMDWPERIRYARGVIIPSPGYMRQRYGLTSNRRLPAAYLRRMRRIAADVAYSIRRRVAGDK